MSKLTRRSFLSSTSKTSIVLTAGAVALATSRRASAAKKSDPVRLAVVGIHGRGGIHAQKFAARPDSEIAYLCDVDETLFAPLASHVEHIQGKPPKTASDF